MEKALKYFDDLQDIDLSTIELPKLIFLVEYACHGWLGILDAFNRVQNFTI
jgi:hypothetical protein